MYFKTNYFLGFTTLLLVEILIAKYATGFLRHTVGDIIAPVVLYFLIKTFVGLSIHKTLLIVIIISFAIEFLQLSNLQQWYPKNMAYYLKIILGTSFDVGDLIAYCIGVLLVFIFEKNRHQF